MHLTNTITVSADIADIADIASADHKGDAAIVAAFLTERYRFSPGARLLFKEVYAEFTNYLGTAARWSKVRFTRALPEAHRTVKGNANVSFVTNIELGVFFDNIDHV